MKTKDIQVHVGNTPPQPDWDQCCIRATVTNIKSARRNLANAVYSIGHIMTKRDVYKLYTDTIMIDGKMHDLLRQAENIAERIDEATAREKNARESAVLD